MGRLDDVIVDICDSCQTAACCGLLLIDAIQLSSYRILIRSLFPPYLAVNQIVCSNCVSRRVDSRSRGKFIIENHQSLWTNRSGAYWVFVAYLRVSDTQSGWRRRRRRRLTTSTIFSVSWQWRGWSSRRSWYRPSCCSESAVTSSTLPC